MKKLTLTFIAAMFAAPAMAHDTSNTPMCDRLDRETNHISINGDLDFDNEQIVLKDEDGNERMVITEQRELYYEGKRLELTPRGQQLVNTYYDTFEAATDDFMDLAGDAAGLGVDAAATILTAIFSGDFDEDEIEREMETKAAGIEASADAACAKIATLEVIEKEMATEIDGFEPVLFAN